MASCGSGFSRKLLAPKIKSSRLKPLPRECGHGSSGQQPAHLAQRGHDNLDLLVRVVDRPRRGAGGRAAEPRHGLEERRVGKGGVRTGGSGWSRESEKTTT